MDKEIEVYITIKNKDTGTVFEQKYEYSASKNWSDEIRILVDVVKGLLK